MAGNSPLGPMAPAVAQQGNTYSGGMLQNAGGFLQSLLGSLQQDNVNRDERKLEQAKLQSVQQTLAKQQLDERVKILRQPGFKPDPKFVAETKKLALAAGLPDPTNGGQGVMTTGTEDNPNAGQVAPGGQGPGLTFNGGKKGASTTIATGAPMAGEQQLNKQPTLQKESLDMNILDPKPNFATDAPEATKQYINSLPPGPVKKAMLAGYSNVPDGLEDAPAVHTSSEIVNAQKIVSTTMTNLMKGIGSPAGTKAALSTLQGYVDSGDISLGEAQSMLTDPSIVGPAVQAKMTQLENLGLSQKSMAAYREMLTTKEPQRWAAQLAQGNRNIDIRQENADTNRANSFTLATYRASQAQTAITNSQANVSRANAALTQAQTAIQRNNLQQLRQSQTERNQSVTALNAEYKTITQRMDAMISAGQDLGDKDDPNSILSQAASIKAVLDSATGVQSQANQMLKQQPSDHVQNSSGNGTATVGGTKPTGKPIVPDGPHGPLWLNAKGDGYVDKNGNAVQ